MYRKVRRGWTKHFDFLLIDLCCAQISLIIAYLIRLGEQSPYSDPIYRNIAILMMILQICIVFFTEALSGILKRGYLREFKAVIKYCSTLSVSLLVILFISQLSASYSRIVLFNLWWISCIFMYIVRIMYKYYLHNRVLEEKNQEHMYLVTNGKLAPETVTSLVKNCHNNSVIKGIIVIDCNMMGETINGVSVVANAESMLEYVRSNVVDEVFINCDNKKVDEEITDYCLKMGITVHINLERSFVNLPNAEVESINGFTVLTASINSVTARQLLIKRLIDIGGSVVGLILTAVVYVFIAPIIYIQSPGPILFSQKRVGKNGRQFKIFKFRSMYMDAEERKKELMKNNKMQGHMFKMDNDPRITPIGRFIRKTSIDELPQLFNILKGEMSLVGTRPPTVDEYEAYEMHHKKRLAIKPGLTGMWQVCGRNDITDFEKVVELDTQYIEEWTLGLDVKILLKTLVVVLGRRGSI